MAWPKRGTRKVVVDNEEFLWHYDACCPWCSDDVFTAGKAGHGYVLYIDPFPHAAAFSPKYVAESIRWALSEGWSPSKGPTSALSLNTQTKAYFWLQDGKRHAQCVGPVPDNI